MPTHPQQELADLSRSHSTARDAVLHALADMEAALTRTSYKIKPGTIYYEMRRDLPYVIHETSIPGVQILVNRSYKPLGSNEPTGGKYLSYEDYPNAHVRLTAEQIASVVSPSRKRGLFGDDNAPWVGKPEGNAYVERVRRLLSYLS